MMNYRKGKNVEEELTVDKIPIENLPEDFLWMKVNGGTKLTNVVDHAVAAVKSGKYRDVLWTGSGGGVPKTVSCAEIMKRDFKMNQITRINYNLTEEHWDPQIDGLDPIVVKRRIPTIYIYLTLNDIDKAQLGFQNSETKTGMWLDSAASQSKGSSNSKGPGNRPQQGGDSGSRNNNKRKSGGGGANNRGGHSNNNGNRNPQQGNSRTPQKNKNTNQPAKNPNAMNVD